MSPGPGAFRLLFARRNAEGVEMTVCAAGDPDNSEVMRASTVVLADDLLAASEVYGWATTSMR